MCDKPTLAKSLKRLELNHTYILRCIRNCAVGHTVLQRGTYLANEGDSIFTVGEVETNFRLRVCEKVV